MSKLLKHLFLVCLLLALFLSSLSLNSITYVITNYENHFMIEMLDKKITINKVALEEDLEITLKPGNRYSTSQQLIKSYGPIRDGLAIIGGIVDKREHLLPISLDSHFKEQVKLGSCPEIANF